jgi:hypothetical protein
MGGFGSGGCHRWGGKKSTVEESLVIGMKDLRRRLYAGMTGMLSWTWTSGRKSSISYFVTGGPELPTVTLLYRWNDKEDVRFPVSLEVTPTHFGGLRWWFTCPLIVRNIACNRRAGKLYLPPGAKYFGCRKCHGLTYRSCQEAHHTERLFGRLGFDAEVARLWERMRCIK